MTALAALIVVVPVLRSRSLVAPDAGRDIAVYADQLAEVGRDQERGVIGATEAEAARVEISRRILRADRPEAVSASRPRRRVRAIAATLLIIAVPSISLALYWQLGSPALPDDPLAERKAAPIDKLAPDELIARLDARLAANPDDVKGWDVAGPVYMRIGRIADAINAFQTAIRLAGPDARRETGLGEALTADAKGVVTTEARAAFDAALKVDANAPLPKMYLALALAQDGRLQDSADAWRSLIASAGAYQPWLRAARAQLAAVEAKIAEQNGGAPMQSGPAAASAPSGDQQAMIEGMVAQLRQRLDENGGSAEEWSRLIKSYVVLGRLDDAKAIYQKAKAALAVDPVATDELNRSAEPLGVTQ